MVHWTLALTHALPLRLHTQGPMVTETQSRCTLLCVWMCAGMHVLGVCAHVLLTKGTGLCQQRVNAD